MIEIGNYNQLRVSEMQENGAYLTDDEGGRIFFPGTYFPENLALDDSLMVFVYCDSLDRPVATTETPAAVVNQFAALVVKDIAVIGAFLDWNISKDLFVPHSQMLRPLQLGERLVVRILLDDISNRLIATPRLRPFLKEPDPAVYLPGIAVECLVYERREQGIMVIMNNESAGLIQRSEFTDAPDIGTTFTAYVREFREDGKVTLSLAPVGSTRQIYRDGILEALDAADGFLPFNDSSSPEAIREAFGVSKKSFKKLIGNLLKSKQIRMDDKGIYRNK